MFKFLSLILFLVSLSQCVLSIPTVKETMFSLIASDVNDKWNEFKLKHSRYFKSESEETQKY